MVPPALVSDAAQPAHEHAGLLPCPDDSRCRVAAQCTCVREHVDNVKTHVHPCIYVRRRTHSYTHTLVQSYTQVSLPTYVHTRTYTDIHVHTLTYTYTYIHVHRTYTHAYTRTHVQVRT
jgi:hypothetical protein